MKKKVRFSLVYRDMWQSSGKFQPRKDQLARIAPVIIEMGCFDRVETNGGAFEQVNLLAGENPNEAVRAFCKPFNEVGIKTHMLDRGLNALRMYPVPDDVRQLMYKVKKKQGTDITRIFCGLNDVRNIIPSIKYAKEGGMIPQATLCITTSPIHTAEYYSAIADKLIEAGAAEICLKDMAGIGQPAMLGKLTGMIKKNHPDIIIQYHGHSGPGLSMASILEVCNNGADIIDTAIEPLSWGKVHPDVISVQSMLKNEGFDVSAVAKVIALKNFQWELGATMGHYVNKITQLPDNQQFINNDVYGATIRSEVGHPANMFYGYKTEGVFATSEEAKAADLFVLGANGREHVAFGAGDMHFKDMNGDHQITEADRTFIGDPNPDIFGNIFTSLAYKRIRLDLNFNYSLGNDVYNYMRSQLEGGSRFLNQTTAMTKRWQTEGQQTDIPKATFQDPLGNSRFSDRWIEDGSYLRLKTVTLSYTLPVNSTYLQGLQFWIQANNLLTFSKYLGSDPEFTMTGSVIGQGIDLGQLPMCRSFVAGIKINL